MIDQLIRVKPRLRGVSHQVAFFVASVAGILLVVNAPSGRAMVAAGIYATSLALLFGISAVYHRPMWSQSVRAVLRRVDHSLIFVLIAGTYTPICMLSIPGALGNALLITVWALAVIGVARSVLWSHAPRAITAGLCVAVGCVAVPFIPAIIGTLQTTNLVLLATGGVLYIVGAGVYAMRRPDPLPALFGYHEVFHLLVVIAGVFHFVAVTSVVSTATAV